MYDTVVMYKGLGQVSVGKRDVPNFQKLGYTLEKTMEPALAAKVARESKAVKA